jgi:4-alpha-glucanotransferase
LAVWWRELSAGDRDAVLALPVLASGSRPEGAEWSDGLRDRWLEQAYVAGSRHLFLPLQDVFGWDARINLPGTVGNHNWTWRLPWPDGLTVDRAEGRERATFLHALSAATGRGTAR